MKRVLLCILLPILFAATARGSDERSLRREISLLNLLNGLYLTEEQMIQLIDLSRRADDLRGEVGLSSGTEKAERFESFQRLRDELVYGADVPKDIQQDASLNNRRAHKKRDQYMSQMARIAEEVEAVFNEGQKEIIDDFKPCLIPPRDLKNPERVGQASSSGPLEKALSRLRDARTQRRQKIKRRVIGRHIERLSRHEGPLTDEETEAERQRISNLIEHAMATSDVDFEMKKDAMAREFKGEKDRPKPPLRRKIARFFLSPRSTQILEDKLSGMGSLNENSTDDTGIGSNIENTDSP